MYLLYNLALDFYSIESSRSFKKNFLILISFYLRPKWSDRGIQRVLLTKAVLYLTTRACGSIVGTCVKLKALGSSPDETLTFYRFISRHNSSVRALILSLGSPHRQLSHGDVQNKAKQACHLKKIEIFVPKKIISSQSYSCWLDLNSLNHKKTLNYWEGR